MSAAPDTHCKSQNVGFMRRVVSRTAFAFLALTCSLAGTAWAQPGGGGGGANCTITTVPNPANITEGDSVDFVGSVSGKSPQTYSWTFEGGSPTSSDQQTVTVTYATQGTYTATLDGTNGKGQACTASVTVDVAPGGTKPVCSIDTPATDQTIVEGGTIDYTGTATDNNGTIVSYSWTFGGGTPSSSTVEDPGTVTYDTAGVYQTSFTATDTDGETCDAATRTITVEQDVATPTGRGDAYATPVDTPLDVEATSVSGVLYNDFGGTPPLTAELVSGPGNGSLALNSDGSFSYTPNANLGDNDNDSFVYRAIDALGEPSADTTVNINILSKQIDFKIFMNYELGMHCTGFEFAYCCVLPPYNSILAQVVKPNTIDPDTGADFARLLEGDHNNTDSLGRPVVMRDYDGDGNINKYFLEYYHDAQPRREGQGKTQTSTLISAVEGNSLFYHQTIYDSAALDANGALVTGTYEGVDGVVLGDGVIAGPTDNYANGWLNHFYIYADLEGTVPGECTDPPANAGNSCTTDAACDSTENAGDGICDTTIGTTRESNKIRLGVQDHIEYPADSGAALQPMGPTGNGAFDNVLTFSGDTGTVVYTQMKVLENLPVMLTSPGIWEALGLPLTPFEDTIDFFSDDPLSGPGSVDEDSIRPYVAMKARLHEADCDGDGLNCTQGAAVIGSNGHPVIGFGTAPIDIPNCERCHSVPAQTDGVPNTNSPSWIRGPVAKNPDSTDPFSFPHGGTFSGASLEAITNAEYEFWNAYYNIVPGVDSDWYSRLKGAAINMLALHDFDQGTGFTSNWPSGGANDPVAQNTRLGKESVICQKCHGDNVIAVVKSGTVNGNPIKPISGAIHWRHREISEGGSIDFADAAGRSGGCQGCHPAHRSDGVMDGYPITLGGDNEQAESDNRLAAGGCFVGRDVHSNANKDNDGTETPAHLNAVGDWLATNVFYNQDGEGGVAGHDTRGLWCTNCHTQLGQEMWAAEDCNDLINGDCVNDVRGLGSLSQIANAINSNLNEVESWLDPKNNFNGNITPDGIDHSHRVWDPAETDAMLATIEVGPGGPVVTFDGDGDPSVNILSFCTTDDCVAAINANKGDQSLWRYPANPFIDTANDGVAVPFSAATDGRDHWLSPGEPHCADCHAAPYVEQSGNINPFPPFNYPAKASLMRYSKGHQGITCQGCHESIHGLYPVTPTIDSTSYAQAAALNHDGSHGPLKCGTCHEVNGVGVPTFIEDGITYNGQPIKEDYDAAVSWAHTFTDNADPRDGFCVNCHEDNRAQIASDNKTWTEHAFKGRSSRKLMDEAEVLQLGYLAGDPAVEDPLTTVCTSCHGDRSGSLSRRGCTTKWVRHLTQGRASEAVWEYVSENVAGSNCGW